MQTNPPFSFLWHGVGMADMDLLLQNKEKLASRERFFQLIADEAFDTNSAIAYQLGNQIPESNKSTFCALPDMGILLDKKFVGKIAVIQ